jgi:hypothetical protein
MVEQRRNKKVSSLVVHPKFHTLLKIESALNGKTIYQFTKDLGEEEVMFGDYLESKDKKTIRRKGGFGFQF